MAARLSALLMWTLVALSATFWVSRVLVADPARPPSDRVQTRNEPSASAFTRMLGEAVPAAADAGPVQSTESRFKLSGVVAPTRIDGTGIALIAIDGKRVGTYRVGARIDGDVVLKSVSPRSVTLAPPNGAPPIRLELPLPAPAATGVLHAAADVIAPVPATDLVQDTPHSAQALPGKQSPGRRQRLRGLDTPPTSIDQ